jgi:hypothetical protein
VSIIAFSSLSEAEQQNAESRIYMGVHWQFAAPEPLVSSVGHATRPSALAAATLAKEPIFAIDGQEAIFELCRAINDVGRHQSGKHLCAAIVTADSLGCAPASGMLVGNFCISH